MLKLSISFILLNAVIFSSLAQSKGLGVMPYGKVDKADLEATSCDFEKDANAEVLFDKANISPSGFGGILTERHIRIKIFNDFGKKEASVRIYQAGSIQDKPEIEGETINLNDGKIDITKLDKAAIYAVVVDKYHVSLSFAFPNVKPGSIIEYRYKWKVGYFNNWYFQSAIPTRYSEITTDFPYLPGQKIRLIPHVKQPYLINVGDVGDNKQVKALADIHSLPIEPYMGSRTDNLQRIEFLLIIDAINTWDKIGEFLTKFPDFSDQIDRSITGENLIIKKAKTLKSRDEQIAFVFDSVKNSMKWNGQEQFYSVDGTVRAWDKKVGNSAEINMIVCRLLKKCAIKACPMIVSTKENGKISPINPSLFAVNSMVVYVPVVLIFMFWTPAINSIFSTKFLLICLILSV